MYFGTHNNGKNVNISAIFNMISFHLDCVLNIIHCDSCLALWNCSVVVSSLSYIYKMDVCIFLYAYICFWKLLF